tara:strand:- start:701 stop:1315 length:615 start_codon:yes stop_codon:yes gene_type:complete
MQTIILDFETSGLNPYHDDIIEIGAKIKDKEIQFQTLLKPKSGKPISKKINEITGISNKLLREKGKPWISAYKDLFNWIIQNTNQSQPIAIISHNGNSFDFIFLKRLLNSLKETGEEISKLNIDKIIFIDTLLLTKRLLPERSYYSQNSLAKYFQIPLVDEHRAIGDVIVLEQIYIRCIQELCRQNNSGYNNPILIQEYINLDI